MTVSLNFLQISTYLYNHGGAGSILTIARSLENVKIRAGCCRAEPNPGRDTSGTIICFEYFFTKKISFVIESNYKHSGCKPYNSSSLLVIILGSCYNVNFIKFGPISDFYLYLANFEKLDLFSIFYVTVLSQFSVIIFN